MCFKICHDDTDIEVKSVYVSMQNSKRGHINKLLKQPSRVNARKLCFAYRVFMPWNDLPASVVESANINIFMKRIDTVNLKKYCKYIL